MNRDGHRNKRFFIGPEVEHSPAFAKKTLFVIGKQPIEDIVALVKQHKIQHVFMGADHSFFVDPSDSTFYWDNTITNLLDRGLWVSLDYQAHEHGMVLNMLNKGIWQSRLFVPMLSVRVPHVQTSSPNLTIKIDDIDFKATNPGVWCLNHHEVTDSNRFTDWSEYGSDVVVDVADKPTPMPPYQPEPVYAEVNRPVIDLKQLKAVVSEDKNDTTLGIDPTPTTALKPDEEEKISAITTPPSITEAAAAYADGATEDPLGKEAKKAKAKK